jgi:hypothetical protein
MIEVIMFKSSRCIVAAFCASVISAGYPARLSAAELTPQAFLDGYRSAAQELAASYDQVHISAQVTESLPKTGQTLVYELELLQDGKDYKVVENPISGDKPQPASIVVADPDISFSLARELAQTQYAIKYLSSRRGLRYEEMRRSALGRSMLFRAQSSYFEMPVIEYLSMRETSILSAKEERAGGKTLVRVHARVEPWSDQLRKADVDYSDAWFLFEPASRWALRGFEIKHLTKDKQPLFSEKSTVEYGDPQAGVPVLRRVTYDTLNKEGRVSRTVKAEINRVSFGPIDHEEFTLRGCGMGGVEVEGGRGLPLALYWSVAVSLLAVGAVLFLRRRARARVAD